MGDSGAVEEALLSVWHPSNPPAGVVSENRNAGVRRRHLARWELDVARTCRGSASWGGSHRAAAAAAAPAASSR